jgi:hypothetical protein
MEMLTEFGYFNSLSPTAYYLYGMVMMLVSAWLALNLERPKKQDY